MLTVESRNERYIAARIKRDKAQNTADRAKAALAKVADLDADIEWLAAAPVKDAPKDENGESIAAPLPTDEQIETVKRERLAKLAAKRGTAVAVEDDEDEQL